MDKTKREPGDSDSEARPFTFEFVVPLQLEACIQRAKNNVSDSRLNSKIRGIGEVNRIVFQADFNLSATKEIHGQGTLQRWQGTSTRVQIDEIYIDTDAKNFFNRAKPLFMLLLVSCTILVCIDMASSPPMTGLPLIFLWAYSLGILGIVISYWIARAIRYRQRRIFVRRLRHLLTAES
jgi:hypothetical protein